MCVCGVCVCVCVCVGVLIVCVCVCVCICESSVLFSFVTLQILVLHISVIRRICKAAVPYQPLL